MQLLFSGAIPGAADERGVTGLLGIFDAEAGRILHRCEYRLPEPVPPGRKIQFNGFCFDDGRLFVCSFDEILVFESWPPVEPAQRITLPGFNDLHHCHPWDGGLAVANTGLETVDLVSREGVLLRRWDLLAGESGARCIDDARDYRRLADTKPHRRHVNHLFVVDGELWATQLRTTNAVCLDAPERSVDMEVGMPHDGRRIGERIVFTTTNGHLVFVDPNTMKVARAVDLAPLTPGLEHLGWCRGVCADPRYADRFFVAFTSLRRSRWREFGYWIKRGQARPLSRVALYDLRRGGMLASWELGPRPGYVLFQLDPLPAERWL